MVNESWRLAENSCGEIARKSSHFRGIHLSNKSRVPARRLCTAILVALLASGNAGAFKPVGQDGHLGIVNDGASLVSFTTASGEVLRFDPNAILEIQVADARVDLGSEFSVAAAHCDAEILFMCTKRMIDLKNEAITALSNPLARDPRRAREAAGRALHTIQDFYSHTNWVSSPGLSHASFNPALGRTTITSLWLNQATCLDDDSEANLTGYGLTNVTSGYFDISSEYRAPPGKCLHGLGDGPGLNKDTRARAFFVPARREAVDATKDFLLQIIDAVKGDESAVRAFLGVRSSVGFVIDDSGSMGRYINGVNGSIYTLGQEAIADPSNSPDRFVLQTFNDPTIGSPQVYSNYNSLQSALYAIRPDAGGDCPELAMTGVMSAVTAAKEGSSLFVYTDASAKDSGLRGAVGSYAASKKVILNYVVSGSCSPIDPAYYETAARTGGALFLAYNTELATPFLRALSSPKTRLVFSASETLAGDLRRYRVNVDSVASQLTVAVGTDNIQNIKLIDPDGVDVSRNSAVTKLINFYSGAFLTVATPKPGEWTFEFSGTGKGFANAYVSSPIAIMELDPVEEAGRAEHTGLFPINGQPVVGSHPQLSATLIGASADSLEVRKLSGELVSSHTFTPAESEELDGNIHKYLTTVEIGQEPVRFFLRGKDANGVTFLRAYPTSYAAQSIRVHVQDAAFVLRPGQQKIVNFVIDNLGAEADIEFMAHASGNVIDSSFGWPTVHVAAGASATVGVPVTVPADSDLESVTLLATAVDANDSTRTNSSVVSFMVASADSDSDGVLDDQDACPLSIVDPTVRIEVCDSGVANHIFPDGCSISDEVRSLQNAAKNHGDFVSSTSHYTKSLVDLGVLVNQESASIQRCAAKSKSP